MDLSKYIDKTIRVKFQGGRKASGVLKGFDPLLNLVLDGTIEHMRGELHPIPPCPMWIGTALLEKVELMGSDHSEGMRWGGVQHCLSLHPLSPHQIRMTSTS